MPLWAPANAFYKAVFVSGADQFRQRAAGIFVETPGDTSFWGPLSQLRRGSCLRSERVSLLIISTLQGLNGHPRDPGLCYQFFGSIPGEPLDQTVERAHRRLCHRIQRLSSCGNFTVSAISP